MAAGTVMQGCRKNHLFSPQVWWGDNCARQDETNPGERGYSMVGGNRFIDGFSNVRGLLAMPPALMFAKPFDQHLCGLTSGKRQRIVRENEVNSSTSDTRMNRSSSFMIGTPRQQKSRANGGLKEVFSAHGSRPGQSREVGTSDGRTRYSRPGLPDHSPRSRRLHSATDSRRPG